MCNLISKNTCEDTEWMSIIYSLERSLYVQSNRHNEKVQQCGTAVILLLEEYKNFHLSHFFCVNVCFGDEACADPFFRITLKPDFSQRSKIITFAETNQNESRNGPRLTHETWIGLCVAIRLLTHNSIFSCLVRMMTAFLQNTVSRFFLFRPIISSLIIYKIEMTYN